MFYLLLFACNENLIVETKDTDTDEIQSDSGTDTNDTETDSIPKPDQMVYLHTKNQLYSYSYDSAGFSGIGTFSLSDGSEPNINDIAINSWGDVYAVSTSALYKVNPTNAELTFVSEITEPLFGLTFDQFDTLYGVGNQLFIINTESTALIPIELDTQLNNPGDLVGLPDGSLWCFMQNPDDVGDVIISIEAQTGTTDVLFSTEFEELWGAAYAMDIVMAFSTNSELIIVNLIDGTATASQFEIANIWGATVNPLYTR